MLDPICFQYRGCSCVTVSSGVIHAHAAAFLQQYCVQTRSQLISKHVTLVMVQLSEVPALSRATIHTCNMPHMLSLQGCGEVWSANSTVLRCNRTLNYLFSRTTCCLLSALQTVYFTPAGLW